LTALRGGATARDAAKAAGIDPTSAYQRRKTHKEFAAVWVGLAVTIMAGLTIGTFFTMIVVPVLYATFYRISAGQLQRSEPREPLRAEPAATA
jgi:hypothetical protein